MLLQEVHNLILCPIRVFSSACPVKEPAMTPVARCDYPNLRMVLNRGHREHGIWNKGIILCCDDEGGDVNGIEHTACPCLIVVVGSAGVSPVRSRVAVVEFTEKANPFQSSKIPLAREELRFPPQAPFKLGQEMIVIDPVPWCFQGFGTLNRIDSRADRDRAGQCCA